MNPLNNKAEISRYNLCGLKFDGEKTLHKLQKNTVMIYDYMNN